MRSRVLVQDPTEAEWVAGHLRPLVGLGSDTGGGGESRGEAFAAWRRFFEAMGEQRPTVLVFEDLHWADDGLLEFVDGLVDRATGRAVVRPLHRAAGAACATSGLGRRQAERAHAVAVRALRRRHRTPDRRASFTGRARRRRRSRRCCGVRSGNPLFAEEYIRMLKDRGLLRRDGETWRLDATEVDVPETVQGSSPHGSTRSRRTRKRRCRTASVVGKVFWLGSVAAIADISAREAEERLHALERKELVRRDRRASVAGETEYAVRHVLVRDVAYGQIPRAAAPTCTSARRSGSSRSATSGQRIAPRCWPITTSPRWS